MKPKPITQEQALDLCVRIEEIVAPIGWHAALTGGCLYKAGPRKDADILLYPHDVNQRNDSETVVEALKRSGVFRPGYGGPASTTDKEVWVGTAGEHRVDLFFLTS